MEVIGITDSKINRTQVVGAIITVAAAFGFDLGTEGVVIITLGVQAVTFVLRTWFSGREIDV